ncbi:hypothetical protein AVEN_90871-1 [Araneus ventricosus]|uniref:Uncharacterized protein n=1 Tax=Araneus ventricosus TaxID=182803 RepID=A0A4Y2RF58_ARAVE|nr:hypothetical protein AVEN_90871-1 [Araneus ventricosus]
MQRRQKRALYDALRESSGLGETKKSLQNFVDEQLYPHVWNISDDLGELVRRKKVIKFDSKYLSLKRANKNKRLPKKQLAELIRFLKTHDGEKKSFEDIRAHMQIMERPLKNELCVLVIEKEVKVTKDHKFQLMSY